MAEKHFDLTKAEIDRCANLLTVARQQEEIMNCITESYRLFIIGTIFKRVGVDPKDFVKTVVDIGNGILIVREEEKAPASPKVVPLKGKPTKDAN